LRDGLTSGGGELLNAENREPKFKIDLRPLGGCTDTERDSGE
jgi:hypothetical protein